MTYEILQLGGNDLQGFGKSSSKPRDFSLVGTWYKTLSLFIFVILNSTVLRFSHLFGVLPVSNITSSDVYRIRYRWLSFPSCIAGVLAILNGLEFMAVIKMLLKIGVSFHTVGALTFFIVYYLEQLMLWRLATNWPEIIQFWHRTEEVFFSHAYQIYASTFNMSLTIKILSGILLVNTFLEHSMYLVNAVNRSEIQRTECNFTSTLWENLFRNERTQLHLLFPLKMWMLPILEWTNLSMAYTQSFTDIFIMCVSIGVTARLKQIHQRISAVCEKRMPNMFWKDVRTDFLAVKNLVRILDSNLEGLTLTSCGYSMYFICLQLFNSFKKSGNLISTIFFWYSLMFIIGRTLFKLFAAANVNDMCNKILSELRNVPSSSWGIEVQRLSEQLVLDITAFSGCGYFYLTRKLIFAMAATIVTYELVMTDVVHEINHEDKDLCSNFI